VSPNLFDAASRPIQATCKLLAAPLDAILTNIERKDIQSAARAKESAALALAEERSRHEATMLLAVADKHRRHEAAAQTAESEALTLAEGCCRHKAATRASLSAAASSLVDERSRHEGADQAATLATLALAVCPRARPHRHTGRRKCPRAPSPPNKAAPSHPHQMLGGLHTPALTTLAQATSLCPLVVSSTTPTSMAPPTPSLLPFTFLGDVECSSSGGGATYPYHAKRLPHHGIARNASHVLVVSCMPASWPLCSQSSGASSLRATSLALRSQPIYS